MAAATTLRLPIRLKARIVRLAKEAGRSAHSLMVEALEREVGRAERMREFIHAARAADAEIQKGGAVYRAEDVHAWLDRFVRSRGKVGRLKT